MHLLHHESPAARAAHQSPPRLHRSLSSDSLPPTDRPYIGKIRALWQSRRSTNNKRMRVSWYYSALDIADDVDVRLSKAHLKHAIFTSAHEDENSVESISGKCALHERAHFATAHPASTACQSTQAVACYFVAGGYDPVANTVTHSGQHS